jgi:hypothetical protein
VKEIIRNKFFIIFTRCSSGSFLSGTDYGGRRSNFLGVKNKRFCYWLLVTDEKMPQEVYPSWPGILLLP